MLANPQSRAPGRGWLAQARVVASHGRQGHSERGRGQEQQNHTVSRPALFYTYGEKKIFVSATVKRFKSEGLP